MRQRQRAQGARWGLAAGQRLGPYEIVAPLGAGGMGEVWRARDTRLGRDVAIKVLPAGLAQGRFFYYLDSRRLLRMPVEGGAPTQLADSVGFLNLTLTDRGVYSS